MIYKLKDSVSKYSTTPLSNAVKATNDIISSDKNPLRETLICRLQRASLEFSHRLLKEYPKQDYSLKSTLIDGNEVPVESEVVLEEPYGDLIRFKRSGSNNDPKVLFIAAMSGHYATLGESTYREFLPDHDVYVTDWKNPRDIPLSAGKFGFEEYVEYLIKYINELGPNTHIVGICQAAVPAMVAAAVMAQNKDPNRPKSMTLMAGPIDIRVNPQKTIDKLSKFANLDMFKLALRTVPSGYAGAGRKVYPGWAQLGVFLSMNPTDHLKKHVQFFFDLFNNKEEDAEKHRKFYDEYMATMDGTGEFFMETLERVFFEFHLPEGKMQYKGELVDCSKVTDIALLTIEGENDDMCLVGNTQAAHDICINIPKGLRKHLLQPGVGHYGVFNGSIYRKEIAPFIKSFISEQTSDAIGLEDNSKT
ncbi:MAG: polyhydroxyalkanoate depolymerase [Neptuniibacter sp.]